MMHENNDNEVSATLAKEFLKEKRADRRWKNIRFIVWVIIFVYIFIRFSTFMSGTSTTGTGKYVSLIHLEGMISPGRDFSAEELVPVLKKAFSDKSALGVVLDINSPGGTPVQAAIIHDAINNYKNLYHKKVIVVGEDLLTSGAYYVAVSADQIYVNPNTLTGSIGVIMKGFGFVELMKKIGIERRVYIAGTDKDRLDPFLPQTPEDLKKIQEVMAEVHQNFVQAVMTGRKGKLQGDPSKLFSGDFWSGQTAVKLGLADHLGNLNDAMQKEFGTINYKEYGGSSSLSSLLGSQLGTLFDSVFYKVI